MTYDGVQLACYINGALVGSPAAATPGAAVKGGSTLALLNRGAGQTSGLPGTLDEVALYNTALTPGQIQTHYLTGIGAPALAPVAGATAAAIATVSVPVPVTASETGTSMRP